MPSLWGLVSPLLYFVTSTKPESLDISENVVLVGNHYVAIGEHADLWIGDMSNKKVAVKVLRGGSSSNPDFLQKFKQVSCGYKDRPISRSSDKIFRFKFPIIRLKTQAGLYRNFCYYLSFKN